MPDRLGDLRRRAWFTTPEVARALGIRPASARVTVSRWVRRRVALRLKNNFLVFAEGWAARPRADLYRVAAFLRVPSYVSLLSALSHHGVSTQVQRGVVECMCLRRPSRHTAGAVEFRYYKTRPALFGGFDRADGAFIASPEKALVDAVHLTLYGRYALDRAALSLRRLDRRRLAAALKPFPPSTVAAVRSLCGT